MFITMKSVRNFLVHPRRSIQIYPYLVFALPTPRDRFTPSLRMKNVSPVYSYIIVFP